MALALRRRRAARRGRRQWSNCRRQAPNHVGALRTDVTTPDLARLRPVRKDGVPFRERRCNDFLYSGTGRCVADGVEYPLRTALYERERESIDVAGACRLCRPALRTDGTWEGVARWWAGTLLWWLWEREFARVADYSYWCSVVKISCRGAAQDTVAWLF